MLYSKRLEIGKVTVCVVAFKYVVAILVHASKCIVKVDLHSVIMSVVLRSIRCICVQLTAMN